MNALDDINISFIGAGKAGVTLGAYFRSKGLDIGGYVGRSSASAEYAADITMSKPFSGISELVKHSKIIFITTPDDRIGEVWGEISVCGIKDKIICHTSGSLTSGIFEGIGVCGAYGYSVHPMYAFAGKDGNFDGLEQACFTIEGDERRIEYVKNIFSLTGNKTIVIDQKNKTLYHIANVMASNLVLALVSIGCECMEECGVGSEESLDALLPLIKGNVDNIDRKGLIKSLTGPAERNDSGTVAKHLGIIPEEYKPVYKILTRRIVELSCKIHPERDYSEIWKMLE